MVHLRIVVPSDRSERALELLEGNKSVCNVIFLEGVARAPAGDVILADVAREDASVVVSDLKELNLEEDGGIAIEDIDAHVSKLARGAVEYARGEPSDAVVWEEVTARTSEATELSHAFVIFMVVAALIAAVGIFLDSPILIVGAMVVGPEFGPVAGICVAIVTGRRDMAIKSAMALAVGFPAAITAVFAVTLVFKATGLTEAVIYDDDHQLAHLISSPDFFAGFVAVCAGVAGVLSLSTAKSGALIGVLISVTTIPAAASIGISAAYGDFDAWIGSMGQLTVNLIAIIASGTITLAIQRVLFERRRAHHSSA